MNQAGKVFCLPCRPSDEEPIDSALAEDSASIAAVDVAAVNDGDLSGDSLDHLLSWSSPRM